MTLATLFSISDNRYRSSCTHALHDCTVPSVFQISGVFSRYLLLFFFSTFFFSHTRSTCKCLFSTQKRFSISCRTGRRRGKIVLLVYRFVRHRCCCWTGVENRYTRYKMDDSELEMLRAKRMAQMQSEIGDVSRLRVFSDFVVLLLLLLFRLSCGSFSLKAIILLRSRNKPNNNVRRLKT